MAKNLEAGIELKFIDGTEKVLAQVGAELDKQQVAAAAVGAKFEKGFSGVVGRVMGEMRQGLGGALMGLQSFGNAADKLGNWGRDLAAPMIAFDDALANMSGTTGFAGKELEGMASQARAVGLEMGSSAAAVMMNMEAIASAMDGKKLGADGVVEVAKQAEVLAKAGKITSVEAGMALANTLNQFQLGAGGAERAINVLAAASSKGKALIPDLAESLKNVGGVAFDAGISIEETAAILETMAAGGVVGAEAGTQLRNIIGAMRKTFKGGAKFEQGEILTFMEKLEGFDYLALEQIFGEGSMNAVAGLKNNIGAIRDFDVAVREQGVATGMAEVKMGTYAMAMQKFRGRVEDVALSMGGFGVALGVGLDYGSSFISGLADMTIVMQGVNALFGAKRVAALASAAATGVEASASVAASAAISGQATATGVATGATWGFNAALLANPITWVVGGIAAAVGVVWALYENFESVRGVVWGLWAGFKEVFGGVLMGWLNGIVGVVKLLAGAVAWLFGGGTDLLSDGWETLGKSFMNPLHFIDVAKDGFNAAKDGYAAGVADFRKEEGGTAVAGSSGLDLNMGAGLAGGSVVGNGSDSSVGFGGNVGGGVVREVVFNFGNLIINGVTNLDEVADGVRERLERELEGVFFSSKF